MIIEEQFGHTLGTLSLSLWLRWRVFSFNPPQVSGWLVNCTEQQNVPSIIYINLTFLIKSN